MIDKTLSTVFGYERVLFQYDEECTNEGDRRLTDEALFVEYEVLFLQASVKLMHCVTNVLFFLRPVHTILPELKISVPVFGLLILNTSPGNCSGRYSTPRLLFTTAFKSTFWFNVAEATTF